MSDKDQLQKIEHDISISLKEYMERRFEGYEKNLLVATRELERRLHELNDWKKETLSERRELTPIALHDRLQNDLTDYKQVMVATLASITTRISNSETRYLTIVSLVGVFLTALTIALHVYSK